MRGGEIGSGCTVQAATVQHQSRDQDARSRVSSAGRRPASPHAGNVYDRPLLFNISQVAAGWPAFQNQNFCLFRQPFDSPKASFYAQADVFAFSLDSNFIKQNMSNFVTYFWE